MLEREGPVHGSEEEEAAVLLLHHLAEEEEPEPEGFLSRRLPPPPEDLEPEVELAHEEACCSVLMTLTMTMRIMHWLTVQWIPWEGVCLNRRLLAFSR